VGGTYGAAFGGFDQALGVFLVCVLSRRGMATGCEVLGCWDNQAKRPELVLLFVFEDRLVLGELPIEEVPEALRWLDGTTPAVV
jgi:hypothetical protein